MPQSLNHTHIALMPKVNSSQSVHDFRPCVMFCTS